MGKGVLYRRSFHSDRDLRAMDTLFDLDQALLGRKSVADRTLPILDGGFDAPRNSLDIPSRGYPEMRRHSEVRSEDIPMGYEFSRSFTTRRRNEDLPATSNVEAPMASVSSSSYVSRLSNLKAKSMSRSNSETEQKPRSSSSSNNVVARLMGLDPLPKHDSQQQPISTHSSSRRISQEDLPTSYNGVSTSNRDSIVSGTETPGYGELPFRNHPQEKQLQEFKREFAARQALVGRHSISGGCLDAYDVHQQLFKREHRGTVPQPQLESDSDDFLDALHFLNANKDFFVKVLNDPNAAVPKQAKPSGRDSLRPKGSRSLTRSFSESRKDSFAMQQYLSDDASSTAKKPLCRMQSRASQYGHDDCMPLESWCGDSVANDMASTRIVVLKPNMHQKSFAKPSSPSSSWSSSESSSKSRFEKKESFKAEQQQQDEDIYYGSKDERDVARQIVRQAKEELNRRLMREESKTISNSIVVGRKLSAQRANLSEAGNRSERDLGSNRTTSKEYISKASALAALSLPSSPRLSRIDANFDHRPLSSNGRRGFNQTNEFQCPQPSRNISRGVVDAKPANPRAANPRKVLGNGSRVHQTEKLLVRSLSLPPSRARSSVPGPRAVVSERPSYSGRSRSAGNSPIKERPKDGVVSSMKKQSKKPARLQGQDPAEMTNVSKAFDRKPSRQRRVASSMKRCENRNMTEPIVDQVYSDSSNSNNMMPNDIPQCCSPGDLVDTASETSLDKCEQPSPVSVLQTPFQEGSPSSDDMKEMRLDLEPEYKDRLLNLNFPPQPAACRSSIEDLVEESLFTCNCKTLDSFSISGIHCPNGREDELAYIRDVFAFSGFTRDSMVMSYAFSPEHGINPSTFSRLEAHYEKLSRLENGGHVPLDLSTRRLVFDVVDEMLALKLKKPAFYPWSSGINRNVHILYTGKQLLEQIWGDLCYRSFVPYELEEDALEDLAFKDLFGGIQWVHSQSDIQTVVIELEKLMCGDLIREVVHELVRM